MGNFAQKRKRPSKIPNDTNSRRVYVTPSISLPSSVKKHNEDFRGSVPSRPHHTQQSLVSPCGLVSTWVWTNEIRELMWTGKNNLLLITLPFQKGTFNFITLISTVSKKWPTEKGFPEGSIHQQEGSRHAVRLPVRDRPSERTPMDPYSKITSHGSPGFYPHRFLSTPSKPVFSNSVEIFLQPLRATNDQLIQSSWMLVGVIRP